MANLGLAAVRKNRRQEAGSSSRQLAVFAFRRFDPG